MILPPRLQPGDLVRVVHAAGRTDRALLDRGIARLRAAGLRVLHDPALGDARGYLAAPDDARAADLSAALADPDARVLLAARGGYGAQRILPAVSPALRALAARPDRWLVGYSDITALHAAVVAHGGLAVHGPLAMGLGRDHPHAAVEFDALLALLRHHRFPAHPPLRHLAGPAVALPAAPLRGGNLSLLAALCGTPWQPRLSGALLFLEEVAEPAYRIDRMLSTLHLSGALDGVAGVLLGQFTGCGDDEASAHAHVAACLSFLGCAVWAGVSSGHGHPNLPLVLGWPYAVSAGGVLEAAPVRGPATAEVPEPPGREIAGGAERGERSGASVGSGSSAVGGPVSGERAMTPAGPRVLLRPGRVGGVSGLLHEALLDGVGSGAQVVVRQGGRTRLSLAVGETARTGDAAVDAVGPGTFFDLASLTKALCTAPLAALARERFGVGLGDRVPARWCADRPTLRDLLRHTSGLPAHVPVFEAVRAAHPGDGAARRRAAAEAFAGVGVDAARVGEACYSDVGYVALGRWLEELFGAGLGEVFGREVLRPLGLEGELVFGDGERPLRGGGGVAATEWCSWRGATLQGVVHDENAQVLGGVAGHAGLFGTADAVARLVEGLAAGRAGPGELAVADMWDLRHRVGTHVLGWDTMSVPVSSAGTRMSAPHTVGHLGFTGTSVWLDRSRGLVVVLLTNRVHPSREDGRIRSLRPAVHDAVVDALEGGMG